LRGDRGSRKGETGGGSGRAGWLNGEMVNFNAKPFAYLGLLQERYATFFKVM